MKKYHKNPRQITKKQFSELEKWLRELGDLSGVVHNLNTDEIIGGNQRSQVFDINSCKVDLVDGPHEPDGQGTVAHGFVIWNGNRYNYRQVRWTEKQCEQANIVANKAGGAWDFDTLANEFEFAELVEWGFDEKELLGLDFGGEEQPDAPEPQIDRAEELRQKWGVELGQMWQLGEHRIICGDCTDRAVVERVMGREKASAVVTDPPYGQNQPGVTNDEPEKLAGIITGAAANLPVDNAVVIAFSSPRTFPVWLDAARAAGHKFERMLWLYKAAQEAFPWRGWLLKSEAILATSVGIGQWQDVHPYQHDCYYKSEVSGELDKDAGWHGSVKPLDVVCDLMQRVSPPGAIVFDGFLGSGTTLVACERLNRRCRAVEISPGYVAVALERWSQMTGKQPELISDGRQ